MNVIRLERPEGIIVTLGGQTAINLAEPLHELGVPIIGTGVEAICNARIAAVSRRSWRSCRSRSRPPRR